VLVVVGLALAGARRFVGAPASRAVAVGCSALWPSVYRLFLAGVLRPEVNLAAANGLYLVLLLLGA